MSIIIFFFFSSRRRHTRWTGDWSSDVCSSDLNLKPKKSCGHDKIHTALIKHTEFYFLKCYKYLANNIFKFKIFPSSFKKANVTLLPKTNDTSNPKNFRPISVLSNLAKVFEKLILDKMLFFVQLIS